MKSWSDVIYFMIGVISVAVGILGYTYLSGDASAINSLDVAGNGMMSGNAK